MTRCSPEPGHRKICKARPNPTGTTRGLRRAENAKAEVANNVEGWMRKYGSHGERSEPNLTTITITISTIPNIKLTIGVFKVVRGGPDGSLRVSLTGERAHRKNKNSIHAATLWVDHPSTLRGQHQPWIPRCNCRDPRTARTYSHIDRVVGVSTPWSRGSEIYSATCNDQAGGGRGRVRQTTAPTLRYLTAPWHSTTLFMSLT